MSDISLNLSVSGMEEGAAVGIDLGTTYSCVGVFKYGKVEIIANDQGSKTTPSYVAFTEDEIIVGDPARQLATRNPDTTIFDAKRLMGKKFYDDTVQNDVKYWPFNVVNENERPKIEVKLHDELKTYYPEEISSMVLRKMKETAECYLGEAVTKAVITVPAYFNDAQRQATKDAAAIAQLDVLRIINEPTAAAIAYGLEKKSTSKRNVMIFDLGGGTFDVSILSIEDGFFEVKSTAGDTHLGGEDFDNRMVNHFAQVFLSEYKKDLTQSKKAMRRLKTACEHAKRTLSAATSADIDIEALYEGIDFYTSITRACFEELNAELFQSTLEPVKKSISDAGLTKDQIDDIVLIGGSSRIPKVRTLLQNFFDGKKLNCSIDPDEAVAYGAALQAAILNGERSDDTKDFLLIDVTPLSLGVGVTLVNGTDVQVVIERNSIVPTRKSTPITTQFDDQHEVWFPVYEGEHSLSKFNSLLGEFALNNIPPARAGKPNFDVTFDIDADGILNVTAVDSATGNKNGITIKYNKDRLSQEEIDRMIKEAQQYKVRNENQKLMTVTKNSLETYLIETKSKISEDRFRYKVNECDKTLVVKKCDEAISWLRSKEDGDLEEFKNKYDELEPIFDLIITMANDPVQTNDMYRKILNINLGASETEIQDGYREAAMKFHPDKIQGDREIANWWFSTILKAKNTLVNLNM